MNTIETIEQMMDALCMPCSRWNKTQEIKLREAIKAGRALLKELKQSRSDVGQEPLFWYRPYPNGMYNGPIHNAQLGDILRGSEKWEPLYTHPQQNAEQNPVGYGWKDPHGDWYYSDTKELDYVIPLYTHPQPAQPKRQPLTAEQVNGLVFDAGYVQAEETADFINGIRHGEAAHGIKGEA